MHTLRITRSAVQEMYDEGQRGKPNECMGYLGGPAGMAVATAVYLLKGRASPSHVRARPEEIAQCLQRLFADGLQMVSLWHTHPGFSPQHSSIDDETIERMLPAGAERLFERPVYGGGVPVVISQDEAHLPRADGLVQRFTLEGKLLPGADGARERAAWTYVATAFPAAAPGPEAVIEGDALTLRAQGMELKMGIPGSAGLRLTTVDPSPVRVAKRFSVILGEGPSLKGKCMVVQDVLGRTDTRVEDCKVDIVADEDFESVIDLKEALGDTSMARFSRLCHPARLIHGLLAHAGE